MAYWKCPKCGSNDTYQGTEIVSEYKQGKSVGFENEFGVTVSQNVSGGTSHKQITVTKCRSCDILLGEQDYHLTAEEHQRRYEMQQAEAERQEAKIKDLWTKVPFTKAYYSARLPISKKQKIVGWVLLVTGFPLFILPGFEIFKSLPDYVLIGFMGFGLIEYVVAALLLLCPRRKPQSK